LYGGTIGKHLKRVMTERGKRELRRDGARARYIDVLDTTVWHVHSFDPTILPMDGNQQRLAGINMKLCLILEVEKD
jgi:hypothetical protein